ncbi:mucin-2-like [Gigantopelta aegis]|uniref:mucin-2-like n=1 Tax=Gigantopelta aegis TaxID=1735272 RepID=UPI001B888F19|nr:mucin-2-like [Gigantopelta aegis]
MVKDSKGAGTTGRLNDTVQLHLHIRDVNDNRPHFAKTGFILSVYECDPIGYEQNFDPPADYLSINDRDLGYKESNMTNCVPVNNGKIAVSADCKVYHIGRIPGGTLSTIQVYGTDRGTHYKPLRTEVPATIVMTSKVCITTTYNPPPVVTQYAPAKTIDVTSTTTVIVTVTVPPATTTAPVPMKSTSNLAWIIPAAILGALALAGLSYLLWKYCSCDSPPPPPPTPPKPVTPPPPEPPKRPKTPDPPEPTPVEEAEVAWVYSGTSVSYDYSTAEVASQQVLVQNVQPVTYEVQPVAYEMQPVQLVGTQPYVTY